MDVAGEGLEGARLDGDEEVGPSIVPLLGRAAAPIPDDAELLRVAADGTPLDPHLDAYCGEVDRWQTPQTQHEQRNAIGQLPRDGRYAELPFGKIGRASCRERV